MDLSTPNILNAVLRMATALHPNLSGTHLDIGAGRGDLIELLRKSVRLESSAVDYTTSLMQAPNVKVDVVDLNNSPLPYRDASFDLVTCTEVIEHIEHYQFVFREALRVLKPGGAFVITTPNILNLKSRIRFLHSGWWNLFGPCTWGTNANTMRSATSARSRISTSHTRCARADFRKCR